MSTPGLLIVTPTRRELAGAERHALTAVVGIGERSAQATREAIATHQPRLLLSIGFSGALDERLRTGDVVISENVTLATDSKRLTLSPSYAAPAQQSLAKAGFRATLGDTLTTLAPLLSSAEKLAQREVSVAAVVDMETYWIATAAAPANVPVLSVRTVLDEAHHNLPKFVGNIVADNGRNEVQHALRALRNPAHVSSMIAMAMHARKATVATRAMLEILAPALANTGIAEAPK